MDPVVVDIPSDSRRWVTLRFDDVTTTVRVSGNQTRRILHNVSGEVGPGQMLAVMGPSGSGKTTLLDVLSGRRALKSGSVTVNNQQLNRSLTRRIGYVLQQDVHFITLTLEQSLKHYARMLIPDSVSDKEKMSRLYNVMEELELKSCRETPIAMLSGGEKKRLSLAVELLSEPQVLVIDEPTSGLDSSTAYRLMDLLKSYTVAHMKTVVVTVHQPASRIFHMFDSLLLLSEGQMAYCGRACDVMEHISEVVDRPFPAHYNPADYIMELVKECPETRDLLVSSCRPHKQLEKDEGMSSALSLDEETGDKLSNGFVVKKKKKKKKCLKSPRAIDPIYVNHSNHCRPLLAVLDGTEKAVYAQVVPAGSDHGEDDSGRSSCSEETGSHKSLEVEEEALPKWRTSFWTQFKVLTQRNWQHSRPVMLTTYNFGQAVLFGFLFGAVWFQLERTESHVWDIQGWMFFSTSYWMLFCLFNTLNIFPLERAVIEKERISGMYRLSAYYLAKLAGELVITFTLPAIFFTISYIMLGVNNGAKFFLMLACFLLNSLVAESFGLFMSAACMDLQVSTLLCAAYTVCMQLFGGFLSTSIPEWLGWMRHLSIVRYTIINMQIVEFGTFGQVSCPKTTNISQFRSCDNNATFVDINDILRARDMESPAWINTTVLVSFLLVFHILGYCVLRFFRNPALRTPG